MPNRNTIFTTIRTEGALLPADLLQRISEGANIDGLTPESYHRPGEKLNEAINRSWNALQGAWASFKTAQERLPENDLGTSITRERWLLPFFRELDYGRLQSANAVEIDGRSYPISHGWEHVPIHLVSYKLDLDKRTPGVAGASAASPHSLLQVYLNRSDANLWGFLSNGYSLRILRDNASLTRQAYVEFDLEAMMTGEVYSDFVLLWLLCHQSRVEGERPSDCWLEKWMKVAEDQGTRALDQLRDGVEKAITALGLGFLEHPANSQLRDKLTSGALDGQDYYRQLLRIVYRLLFLFVAEDRDLLLNPAADEPIRERYLQYYSTQRLRRMAEHFKGTRHPDLFEGLRLVMRLLSGVSTPPSLEGEAGRGLGLIPLGSFLFSDEAVRDTIDCQMSNTHLLDAIRALSLTYDTRAQVYRSVDYRNLGPEELGSIYESLLELHPQINIPARRFALATAGGNERKTTGSYYTPTSLINALLDSALDPVLTEATKKGEAAILALKICDPACGSGHFLIAAANRMAKALATVRTGEEEPPPARVQEAKRDIIGHCIYGVDINPMAVELCKVNLWMEALEPGKPLNFLDHRIQVGNSLLGTTPRLMADGIPDDAFNPIEGDDPKFVTTMKKLNKSERVQREKNVRQLDLFGTAPSADYTALTRAMYELDATPDDTLAGIHRKEAQYAALASDPEYIKARLLADAWCAAFVWEKKSPRSDLSPSLRSGEGLGEGMLTPPSLAGEAGRGFPLPMTDLLYRRLESDPLAENLRETREYVVALKEQYQFFHWHVAFPDVFTVDTRQLIADDGAAQTGWIGGFDCILGNPPWDKIQPEEKKFFSLIAPEISVIENRAQREKVINSLQLDNPHAWGLWRDHRREKLATTHFLHTAGMFPLSGTGNLGTHPIFVDLTRQIIRVGGYMSMIVPSSIVTTEGMSNLFEDLMNRGQVRSIYDFENRSGFFPAIDSRMRFSLVTLQNSSTAQKQPEFGFFLFDIVDIKDKHRIFNLTTQDIRRVNPNSYTCPVFRNRKSAELITRIHSQNPVIHFDNGENHWDIDTSSMFQMTHEASQLHERQDLAEKPVPLWEGKMVSQFNHRAATIVINLENQDRQAIGQSVSLDNLRDAYFSPNPRYWINQDALDKKLGEKWDKNWLISFCPVTSPTNERTCITCIMPRVGTGNSIFHVFPSEKTPYATCLVANLNTYTLDYVLREKMGGINLNHFIFRQLPVISPDAYVQPLLNFIVPRVLELTYTAWDLQPFAQDVGYNGTPFIWDDQRRFLIRCELDALYFHLYQINHADVDYIMDTFPIVKRKDEAAHGTYRTKDTILAMYDQMAALPTLHVPAPKDASATYPVPDVGQWTTWLIPPPADPSVAHKESKI